MTYCVYRQHRLIVPNLELWKQMMDWAKEHEDLFTVYSAQGIGYENEQALMYFTMRWA